MSKSEKPAGSVNEKTVSDPRVELEAKALARANASTLDKLEEGQQPTAWNNWVAKDLAQEDWVVVVQSLESYDLPAASKSFVGANLVEEWARIVAGIQEVHNQLIGLRVTQAQAVLAGDDRCAAINARLRVWADQYVEQRLAKTAYRKGGAVRQFQNIYFELLPQLEAIAFRNGSINRSFFGEFTDYLPTILFDKTCRDLIECKFDKKALLPAYRIVTPDRALWEGIKQIVDVYQWAHVDDVAQILALVGQSLAGDRTYGSDEEIRGRLQLLVDDIEEMRPFLRHNFNADKVLLEVAPGLIISFYWAVGRGVGIIPVSPSPAEMLEHHNRKTSALSLTLTYGGLLANFATPWINTETVMAKDPNALRSNLFMVEAVHAKLYSFYEKVDVAAVLARLRERVKKNGAADEPSEEEFAALCQTISEPVEGASSSELAFPASFRAVRVQRLLAVLEAKLDCEVRQGKGSEIVIFRSGGHHFRLGHHKRNSYVSTAVIKNLLRHVGIEFDQWLAAIS
jgi:hypothetical protein